MKIKHLLYLIIAITSIYPVLSNAMQNFSILVVVLFIKAYCSQSTITLALYFS